MKFSRLVAGTVGLSLCFAIGPFGACAKEALKPRKIGVIVINTGSESLARWANNVQAAAQKLHWEVIIKNGESNPAVVSTLLPELLTQGVDAVITMAVDAPLIAQGLAALKQGKAIRYEGPGGPTSFDSFHDSTGIFQIDTYSPAGAVQVTGNLTAAQLRAVSS